jgi:poly(3-hydroxybutyrate) depolymerase
MKKRFACVIVLLIGLSAGAQTVNLRGKVSNSAGKAIANAVVTLVNQGLKDTTGADGAYLIASTGVAALPLLKPQNTSITMYKTFLDFSLLTAAPVRIELFDVKGNLLRRESLPNANAGFYRFNLGENMGTVKLLVIRASIGAENYTFRYFPIESGNYIVQPSGSSPSVVGGRLAKVTAISDTLKVSAPGYSIKSVAINSYELEQNITLDTAGGGNAARPSVGCGKEPPFKGEKRVTISAGSAGSRDYILRLPDDYDKNHPYPLWFSIHCMSGSADNVAHSEPDTRAQYEYLGIWKFANPANGKGTTIFCAPEGINAAWGQGAKDLQFFRSMINKFVNELCIDQSRLFAEGFSMGGSMSYALACAMPDTFRAICMHSGGSMSGCTRDPKKDPGPVAMFITHGTQDGRCTYPAMGVPQLADLAKRDGCTAMDVPSLAKPTNDIMKPVCVDYKNCNPGFPCRACIFTGDHIGSPGTQGSYGKNNTWADDSTWSFFKQFY